MTISLAQPRTVRDSERGENQPPDPNAPVLDGPAFYSDAQILARYRALREQADGPVRSIEEPIALAFLGDLRDKAILDLGCGDARLGRHALELGASRYLGLDGSPLMVEAAERMLAGTGGKVEPQDLEWWCGGSNGLFDIVVSRLALQYVANLERVFEVIRHHLRPGGIFVFSVEHPIMTSSYHKVDSDIGAQSWQVYDYFREGYRPDHWLDAVVMKQHRTFETYIETIRAYGFVLDRFSEGRPERRNFSSAHSYESRLDVPICAVFRCVRDG